MHRADVLGDNTDGFRVADTMFFDANTPALKRIREVIAKHIGLPIENQEDMSVIRYNGSEKGIFKPHYDCFSPEADYFEAEMKKGGNRVKTCLIYLNDDFEGGETGFPNLPYRIKPKTGKLVVWNNVDDNNKIIFEAEHEGMKVTSGTKYLVSIWVRESAFINK